MALATDDVRARPEGLAQARPWLREEALAVRLDGSGLPLEERPRYPCALARAPSHAEGTRLALERALARAEAGSAERDFA